MFKSAEILLVPCPSNLRAETNRCFVLNFGQWVFDRILGGFLDCKTLNLQAFKGLNFEKIHGIING